MDIKKIKKLIELFEKSNISELEVREKDKSLRISCISLINQNLNEKKNLFFTQDNKSNFSQSFQVQNNNNNNIIEHIIKSPMVGIFYRNLNEESKPFVEVGQKVSKGDTLCIIEAMKMMNQIESDKSGIVKKILVENAQPVEFDEPLLIIE